MILMSPIALMNIKQESKPEVVSITPINWTENEMVSQHIHRGGKVDGAFMGASIGHGLTGDAKATMEFAIAFSNRWFDDYKTEYVQAKVWHHGFRVVVSDGCMFRTEDNSYEVGQIIKY